MFAASVAVALAVVLIELPPLGGGSGVTTAAKGEAKGTAGVAAGATTGSGSRSAMGLDGSGSRGWTAGWSRCVGGQGRQGLELVWVEDGGRRQGKGQ